MEVLEGLLEVFDKLLGVRFLEAGDVEDHVVVLDDVADAKALGVDGTKAEEVDSVRAAVGGGEHVAHVLGVGGVVEELGHLEASEALHLLDSEVLEDKEVAISALALFAAGGSLVLHSGGGDQQLLALCRLGDVKLSDELDALLRHTIVCFVCFFSGRKRSGQW